MYDSSNTSINVSNTDMYVCMYIYIYIYTHLLA